MNRSRASGPRTGRALTRVSQPAIWIASGHAADELFDSVASLLSSLGDIRHVGSEGAGELDFSAVAATILGAVRHAPTT